MTLKRALIRIAKKVSPRGAIFLASLRNRLRFRNQFRREERLLGKLLYQTSPVVLMGPFKGMHYLDEVVWGPIVPKWLGSYECEIADCIETAIRKQYKTIVDVGCAEGYYAVGLALRVDDADVYAFDIDPFARRQVRRLAGLNGVESRVHIGSCCDPIGLNTILEKRAFLICDIEGHERALLDPQLVTNLRHSEIIVEVHEETEARTLEQILCERFVGSHSIAVIESRSRTLDDVLEIRELPQKIGSLQIVSNLNEYRGVFQHWLHLLPKSNDLAHSYT